MKVTERTWEGEQWKYRTQVWIASARPIFDAKRPLQGRDPFFGNTDLKETRCLFIHFHIDFCGIIKKRSFWQARNYGGAGGFAPWKISSSPWKNVLDIV